jgi:hypothetical protein
MMLRCDREYLLVGALIYRKPLRSITNRLEPRNKRIVRLDGSLYRNNDSTHRPFPGGGRGVCTGPDLRKEKRKIRQKRLLFSQSKTVKNVNCEPQNQPDNHSNDERN